MKKIIFFLVSIISLGVFAQPRIIMSNTPNGTYNSSNAFCFIDERGDFSGDGVSDLFVGQNTSVSVFFRESFGLSAIPRTILKRSINVSGIAILKTFDSLASNAQIIYEDTLCTFINDSTGLKFSSFYQYLGYRPSMIKTENISNQHFGFETLLLDSVRKNIHIYHFNGSTCDSLQTIEVGKTVNCLEFGDFNSDNLIDLAVICSSDSAFDVVKIYCQSSNGLNFWKEINLNLKRTYSARMADMYQDGFSDLIISSRDSLFGGLYIVNFADTNMVPMINYLQNRPCNEFVVGDFNSDHYFDIIALIDGLDSAAIYRNNQEGQMIYDSCFYTKVNGGLPKYHSAAAFSSYNDGQLAFTFANGIDGIVSSKNLTPFYSDLKISSLLLSSPLKAGYFQKDSVSLTIKNVGDIVADADSLLSVKISLTLKTENDSILWQKNFCQKFDTLAVDSTLNFNFYFDSVTILMGSRLTVIAEVDSDNFLNELSENNNYLIKIFDSLDLSSLSDLIIPEILFLDTSYGDWDHAKIRFSCKNIGYFQAKNIKIKVFLFLKMADSLIFEDTIYNTVDCLSANENIYLYYRPDYLTADSIIIKAFIDYDSVIMELDENNNYLEYRAKVDWLISLPSSPELASFEFYPNPTSGLINLVIPKAGETVEVFNNLGQRIWFKENASQSIQIDLSDLPSGVYCLRINNLSKKIIKNK